MNTGSQLTPNMIYEMVAKADFRKHFHLGGFQGYSGACNIMPNQ